MVLIKNFNEKGVRYWYRFANRILFIYSISMYCYPSGSIAIYKRMMCDLIINLGFIRCVLLFKTESTEAISSGILVLALNGMPVMGQDDGAAHYRSVVRPTKESQ